MRGFCFFMLRRVVAEGIVCPSVLAHYYNMKHRSIDLQVVETSAGTSLYAALLSLKDTAEMAAFLSDLCTPAELEVLIDRWRVVPYLLEGLPYRQIHACTAVSVTTIGRVARYLNQGSGGYLAAAARTARKRALASGSARA